METVIYSAGYYLHMYRYDYNSMIIMRGNFTYDTLLEYAKSYSVRYSPSICMEFYPYSMRHHIQFYTKYFKIDIYLYPCEMSICNSSSDDFIFLAPETHVAVYKFYYNAEKNNVERYRNTRGNYEV